MKRCSQCDFIYEDDQHLCDMDGHELVYEPTLQPLQINAASLVTKQPTRPVNSGARRQALAAAVAVLIATVLSVGYSGFTSEYAPQNTKAPPTNIIRTPQFVPDRIPATPTVTPTPAPTYSPRSDKTKVTANRAAPIARSTPRLRSPARRQETTRSQAAKANHKESRIGGFLKKTGRVLKKPFKF
jgi:type IV secretory pathway VirB10-like protein